MAQATNQAANVPVAATPTGNRVAKFDRELPTLGDALVVLGNHLQQMQPDDLSIELDGDRERVRLRFRAYRHRNGGGNGGG